MRKIDVIKKIISEHRKELESKYNVKEIGIFGSYVRAQNSKNSDLDVLVEFSKPIGMFKFLELEEYIQNITGIKIDLVSKKALKPRIGQNILKELIKI